MRCFTERTFQSNENSGQEAGVYLLTPTDVGRGTSRQKAGNSLPTVA